MQQFCIGLHGSKLTAAQKAVLEVTGQAVFDTISYCIARLTQGTPVHNALHCQVGL